MALKKDIFINVIADTKKADAALDKTKLKSLAVSKSGLKAAGGISKSLAGLALTAVAVIKVVDSFAKWSKEAAIALAATKRLQAAFDNDSGAVAYFDKITDSILKTVLVDAELLKNNIAAAKSFDKMITNDQLTMAAKLAASLSRIKGIDLLSAFNASRKAVTGNTKALEKMGIVLADTSSLTATYNSIQEVTNSLYLDAIALSDTYEGRMLALQIASGEFKKEAGTAINDIVTGMITLIGGTDNVIDAFQKIGNVTGIILRSLATSIVFIGTLLGGTAATAIKIVISTVTIIYRIFETLFKFITRSIGNIIDNFKLSIGAIVSAFEGKPRLALEKIKQIKLIPLDTTSFVEGFNLIKKLAQSTAAFVADLTTQVTASLSMFEPKSDPLGGTSQTTAIEQPLNTGTTKPSAKKTLTESLKRILLLRKLLDDLNQAVRMDPNIYSDLMRVQSIAEKLIKSYDMSYLSLDKLSLLIEKSKLNLISYNVTLQAILEQIRDQKKISYLQELISLEKVGTAEGEKALKAKKAADDKIIQLEKALGENKKAIVMEQLYQSIYENASLAIKARTRLLLQQTTAMNALRNITRLITDTQFQLSQANFENSDQQKSALQTLLDDTTKYYNDIKIKSNLRIAELKDEIDQLTQLTNLSPKLQSILDQYGGTLSFTYAGLRNIFDDPNAPTIKGAVSKPELSDLDIQTLITYRDNQLRLAEAIKGTTLAQLEYAVATNTSNELTERINELIRQIDLTPLQKAFEQLGQSIGNTLGNALNSLALIPGSLLTGWWNYNDLMKLINDQVSKGILTQALASKKLALTTAAQHQRTKDLWKDFARSIISLILKIIAKQLIMLSLQAAFAALTGGVANAGGFFAQLLGGAITGMGGSLPTQSVNTGNTNVSDSIGIYQTNQSYLGRKLDNIVDAILNFTPVQTQIISPRALANANRMGNAMIIQGT